MTANDTEDHRRVCEARQWLRLGYNNPMDIKSLRARIAAKRGERAAEQLISDIGSSGAGGLSGWRLDEQNTERHQGARA